MNREFLRRITFTTLLTLPLTACFNNGSKEAASQPRSGAETSVLPNTNEITIDQTRFLLDEQLASSAEFVALLHIAHTKLITIWGTEPQNAKGETGMSIKILVDPNRRDGEGGFTENLDSDARDVTISLRTWIDGDLESTIVAIEELSHAFGLSRKARGYLGLLAEAGGEDTLNDIITLELLQEMGIDASRHFPLPDSRFDFTEMPDGIFGDPNQESINPNRRLLLDHARFLWSDLYQIFPTLPQQLKELGLVAVSKLDSALFPWDTIRIAADIAQQQNQLADRGAVTAWIERARATMWNINPGIYFTQFPLEDNGITQYCTTVVASFPRDGRWQYIALGETGARATTTLGLETQNGLTGMQKLEFNPDLQAFCTPDNPTDPYTRFEFLKTELDFSASQLPELEQLPVFIGVVGIKQ